MQLVEHHAAQRAEQIRRVGRGEDQRQLLGRGEQDVRRVAALALALRGRRVAGAGLDADRQPHLGDRRLEVARDVDRERLQRRDVERVQPALAAHVAAGGDETAMRSCSRCGFELETHTTPQRSLPRLRGRDREARASCRPSCCDSTRPASAEIPPASCRRRSARSAAPSARRAPSPAARADARAAPSRASRTSARTVPATGRLRR